MTNWKKKDSKFYEMKVVAKCRHLMAIGARDGVTVKNLWIKKCKVGLFIGKHGRTLHRLRSEYNTVIKDQHFIRNQFALFKLHGSEENILALESGLSAILRPWEYRVTNIAATEQPSNSMINRMNAQ